MFFDSQPVFRLVRYRLTPYFRLPQKRTFQQTPIQENLAFAVRAKQTSAVELRGRTRFRKMLL